MGYVGEHLHRKGAVKVVPFEREKREEACKILRDKVDLQGANGVFDEEC